MLKIAILIVHLMYVVSTSYYRYAIIILCLVGIYSYPSQDIFLLLFDPGLFNCYLAITEIF